MTLNSYCKKVQVVNKRVQKFRKPKKIVNLEKLKIEKSDIVEVRSCYSPLERFMRARNIHTNVNLKNKIFEKNEKFKNLKSYNFRHKDSLKDLNMSTGTKLALQETV